MLYIPSQLRIGYRNDGESYNGKLGYIIHMDNRKTVPNGWEKWRNKDIHPMDIQNVPTTGFKLGKAVGGGRSWNARQDWVRVYDPRGFEFEISVDNLLIILGSSNSIHKELEGEFVYSWNRQQLVLLPVDSIEYRDAMLDTMVVTSGKKFKKTDLIIGHTYTFKNKKQYVYIGSDYNTHRFYDTTRIDNSRDRVKLGLDFFDYFYETTSLTQLLYISDTIDDNWTELSHQMQFSPVFHVCTSVEEVEFDTENIPELLEYMSTGKSIRLNFQPIRVKCSNKTVFGPMEINLKGRLDCVKTLIPWDYAMVNPDREVSDGVFEFRFPTEYCYKFKCEPLFTKQNVHYNVVTLTLDELISKFYVVYLKHNLSNGNYYYSGKLDNRRNNNYEN